MLDENGRVQVAICFNMDLGDAWEWADAPEYPEKYSALALRLGINYVLYDLTHCFAVIDLSEWFRPKNIYLSLIPLHLSDPTTNRAQTVCYVRLRRICAYHPRPELGSFRQL